MRTLIVCGTRYGSTRVIAGWIAERLGFDCLITDVKDAQEPGGFDLVILGSGIYENGFMPEVISYIDKHIKALEDIKKVVFGVCLETEGVFVNGKIHPSSPRRTMKNSCTSTIKYSEEITLLSLIKQG